MKPRVRFRPCQQKDLTLNYRCTMVRVTIQGNNRVINTCKEPSDALDG